MVKKLEAKDTTVAEMLEGRNLEILLTDNAIVDMLESVDKTEGGKRPGAENDKVDL
jgi:TusA-related sulfurtransferase